MPFLNANTFELQEFGGSTPRYAILSHCRGNEILYHAFEKMPKGDLRSQRAQLNDSLKKIIQTCDHAQGRQLESIRSMLRWYKRARVCIVYLHDVLRYENDEFSLVPGSQFARPKWFTRGWTLQELLASRETVFFDSRWRRLGSRVTLADAIEKHAKISQDDFEGYGNASVATRLSWAVGRQTRDEEDRLYSLLGIFDVCMDVRYGEGLNVAFLRLREAIIRKSADESIFAWADPSLLNSGLLAPSVECFANSGDIVLRPEMYPPRGQFDFGNGALRFSAPFYLAGGGEGNDLYYVWKARKARKEVLSYRCTAGDGTKMREIGRL